MYTRIKKVNIGSIQTNFKKVNTGLVYTRAKKADIDQVYSLSARIHPKGDHFRGDLTPLARDVVMLTNQEDVSVEIMVSLEKKQTPDLSSRAAVAVNENKQADVLITADKIITITELNES